MDKLPEDDWFDGIMVFLANNISKICEEWFKLLGWLLIVSTLAFLAQETSDVVLYAMLGISTLLLWFRYLICGHAILHSWIYQKYSTDEYGYLTNLKPKFVWLALIVCVSGFSSVVLFLGWWFATVISGIVHG